MGRFYSYGQLGVVGWFGELLTEKYNPGQEQTIGLEVWKQANHAALHLEWNHDS